MMFIPNTDKYHYPDDTSTHYGGFKMNRGIIFDKDYPYVDYSKGFRFKRFWVRVLLRTIVFPFMATIRFGIKIKGKENLKKNKKLLVNGFVSISNHVHDWDYIFVMKAIHHYKWPYLLSIGENINNDSGPLVRMVGGIPIPTNDNEAKVAFNKAIKRLLDEGNALQIYPEGSLWEYYTPIRPFKNGAASLAVKNNKPVLPMAVSYRQPNWFRRKVMKQEVCFNIKIGRPLTPNPDLSGTKQIDDLTMRMHQAVCRLAGFRNNNPYPPIYCKENGKKIDFKN